MEPHICKVANQSSDPRGESVEIANGGVDRVAVTGLELTDYTETQQHPRIFRFPEHDRGRRSVFGSGQVGPRVQRERDRRPRRR